MTIRIGLRVPPAVGPAAVAEFAAEMESAGVDSAWLPDSPVPMQDVWVTLGAIGMRTRTLGLGQCVTNLGSRHLVVTASAAATLERLCPGRTRLGLGTGWTGVRLLGVPAMRLPELREGVAQLRALMRGDQVDMGVGPIRLGSAVPGGVPLYIAATGDRALQLAGEIADGVIVMAGLVPDLIDRALRLVRAGAARVGRDLRDIDVWFAVNAFVTEDRAALSKAVKPYCATIAQYRGGPELLRSVGIDLAVPERITRSRLDLTHGESVEEAIRTCDTWISDELALRYADAFCVTGSASHAIDQLEAAVSQGVTSFCLRSPESREMPRPLLELGRAAASHFRARA